MDDEEFRERIEGYVEELSGGDANVRFGRLLTICENVFGEPRVKGSHHIFKTPWPGKPWVNLQDDGGEAKSYQVRQVRRALQKRLEQLRGDQ